MANETKKLLARQLKLLIGEREIADIPGGVSQSYIYRLVDEHHPTMPGIERLRIIVEHYGSSLGAFFTDMEGVVPVKELKIAKRDQELVRDFLSAIKVKKMRDELEAFIAYVLQRYGGDE